MFNLGGGYRRGASADSVRVGGPNTPGGFAAFPTDFLIYVRLLMSNMGYTGPKGIVTLPESFRHVQGALASDTSVILDNSYSTALARDFLLKKIRYQAQLEDIPSTVSWLIGFARGDLTIAEITTILTFVLPDPKDFQFWDNYAQLNGIFWETLRQIGGNAAAQDGSNAGIWNANISMGGGKGLPLEAGHGIQMFAFNPSGAAVGNAGTTMICSYQLVGVFMEGSN